MTGSHRRRGLAAVAVALLLAAASATSPTAHETTTTPEKGPSGLPIPRFVSLKSDRANLRQGPGVEYPTSWVFQRAGLPLEVVREFESWRQVRDAEGTTGWVLASMLSGRRTALLLPWEVRPGESGVVVVTLHDRGNDKSSAVVDVEAGALASIIGCDGRWCRISVAGYRGYIEQTKLWGAYKGEIVK